MYQLPESSPYLRPPVEGAVATESGWRHPITNELLVAVRGLLLNNSGGAPTPPPKAETLLEPETIVDRAPEVVLSTLDELGIFSKVVVDGGVEVSINPPNQHKWTKWVVNGVKSDVTGNTITVKEGDEFASSSPKGDFSGKA